MSIPETTKGAYGPGTFTDTSFTPLPKECRRILEYLAKGTPGFTTDPALLNDVEFHGRDLPIIPGPIKAQAFSAVLHAMVGIVGREISDLKGNKTGKVSIDVDQAALYPCTPALFTIDGKSLAEFKHEELQRICTDLDHGAVDKNPMYYRSCSIYPTKDPHVYYQFMGSLHPAALLQAFELDPEAPVETNDEAYELIKKEIVKYSARELEQKCMEGGFCGQTCYSPQAWRDTLMGKQLAAHPVINYRRERETADVPPAPFPKTEDKRPLAGIKVVELARVIAGPAAGAALASLGADVVRVQSRDLPDPNPLQITLSAGKRMCHLDLTKEADRRKLHTFLQDADVIIQAYRRGSLERKGFGLNDMLTMANKRGKGIVYLDVNTYGPDGYYAERPGWQQIADAASGCSYVIGKAYGFEEGVGVLPSLPIADMLTGITGALDVMLALRDRAKNGGSYYADVALTALDATQLEEWVGLYQPEIVKEIQEKHKFRAMTSDLHVEDLLFIICEAWEKTTNLMTRPDLFVEFGDSPFGKHHRILAPLVKYEDKDISPHWTSSPKPYCYHKELAFAN